MNRRHLLRAGLAAGLTGLAGCTGGDGSADDSTTSSTPTTTPSVDLPSGIYVQQFRETMAMQGMGTAGPYRVGLMYSAPHAFWNVNGTSVQKTEAFGDIHLMATVFDPETETVIPETGLSIEIEKEGEFVSQEVIYPMLSQRMGVHYGGNFGLDGDGSYTANVSVGGLPIETRGSFEGKFDAAASTVIDFEFTDEERAKVKSERLDAYGKPGAVQPMEMGMMPTGYAPSQNDLPGYRGAVMSDDARFLVGHHEGRLYASARTRYNGLFLPAAGVEATVTRGSETVFEGELVRMLDPTLGYHYGTDVAVESGDELELRVTTPPQVARHQGYERAFLQFEPMSLTL
ncbi:DUF7350 domain-containing protein [Natronomonas sp. EA1]|uniref:DUF7350 domain-containing protein n=1 Tax=Natronomonas sp. EA1 TaxID=3421655 RepID=UPI003EB7E2BF